MRTVKAPRPRNELRRRRRLEGSGLPYEEPAREPLVFEHGRRPTCAEVLRAARARRHAESLRAGGVEQVP